MPILRLSDFDPDAIPRWEITEDDLHNVIRYVSKLQGKLAHTALAELAIGGAYGASVLLHEVAELRILLDRHPKLLSYSRSGIAQVFYANLDAHAAGLTAEYTYLQQKVHERFGVWCNVGALAMANSLLAYEDLFRTDLPFTRPIEQEVIQANIWLESLKGGES